MARFSDVLGRQLAALENAVPTWRREIGLLALSHIRLHWPSPAFGEDVHPYATGNSYDAWRSDEGQGASITISCPVAYSGYTEFGYTRKGPETARSWAIRSYGPYSMTALLDTPIREVTDSIIREAING